MGNSILDNLNDSHFKNRINLILNADKNNIYCYVEGKDDKMLFRKLLTNNVIVDNCFGNGKGILEQVVVNYDCNNKNRCIGICDKDYNNIVCERLFFCDYCCMEMMIVSNDECFKNVCHEYCETDINYLSLRIKVLKNLETLSKLRKYNADKQCGINFGDGGIKSTVYNDDMNIMDGLVIEELKKLNKSNINYDKIEEYYHNCSNEKRCKNEKELLSITNGHDFISMCFALFKKHLNSTKSISFDRIEAGFRIGYNKDCFNKTKLYLSLKSYQNENNICIVE